MGTPTYDPRDGRTEDIPRPFILPMPVTMTFPPPEGPFAVVHPVTHRIVGTCSTDDRQWWIDAGYIVG